MPTMKRRVVYMTDEEWAGVLRQAHLNKVTASQLVRDSLHRGHLRIDREQNERFNRRPFTPVPKGK